MAHITMKTSATARYQLFNETQHCMFDQQRSYAVLLSRVKAFPQNFLCYHWLGAH